MFAPVVRVLDRFVAATLACGKWLALPVAVLLFLQWPLRDIVSLYSREANDLGQWLFALYVAVCVTAATRARMHLAADVIAHRYSERTRDLLSRFGALLGMVPWALFVLLTSKTMVWSSLVTLEQFPDTYNPGYFIIKLALWLLAILMLIEGIAEILRPSPGAL
jgi:TRAP-type mannitol/chloroaromatic compound transport system permease small subunit